MDRKIYEPKPYTRKNAKIVAMQITNDVDSAHAAVAMAGNHESAWVTQYGEEFLVYVRTAFGTSTAAPGDWVIRTDNDVILVMNGKEFHHVYEEVPA